jgi:ferrous iron transport protein A
MSKGCLLCALREGESAFVTEIFACDSIRRRLLDIGLIPGTKVTCMGKSPAGDPVAYMIRGAVIALRNTDAAGVGLDRLAMPQAVPEAL